MNHRQISWVLLLILIVSCASSNKAIDKRETVPVAVEQEPVVMTSSFTLGRGDEITMNVWRHSDLDRTIRINPEGMIYLPLAGEIEAAGLTITQLRKEVIFKLSKYLKDPQVDINVSALRSMTIYVLGEVHAPGTFALDRRMKPMEAIAKAGGFTHDANTRNILLVRAEKDVTKVRALNLNISDMQAGKNLTPVMYLQNGDVLYVVPSVIANVERFMQRFANILRPFTTLPSAIVLGNDAWDVLRGKGGRAVGVAVQ
jgi:polysaccharide export outer membrane protein